MRRGRASCAGRARLMAEECYNAFEQINDNGWMDEWTITADVRRSEGIQSEAGRARLNACCHLSLAVLVCFRRLLGVLLSCFGVESVMS